MQWSDEGNEQASPQPRSVSHMSDDESSASLSRGDHMSENDLPFPTMLRMSERDLVEMAIVLNLEPDRSKVKNCQNISKKLEDVSTNKDIC